ncbi:CBS domain-containing protein [Thermoplasma sp.]|uniref:CBS domain-containing protein n=1 Tax=Thermoplasma sp. TaxID=1973142 RepID=UPI00261AA20A|nr:CBS domain-containing protein [Thermoplasma sp.]
MKVADIMTPDPITYHVPSSINEVIKVLIKYNVTGVPITDQNGYYVGFVSRRDIFANPRETQTAMVMRRSKAVYEDDEVRIAALEMLAQKKRHLTVIDRENHVKGILTPQNFMKTIRENYGNVKVKEVMKETSVPIWYKTPLPAILTVMNVSGIFSFPVINDDGSFVGLLVDRDIFDRIDLKFDSILSEMGIADDEDPWSWTGLRNVFKYVVERADIKLPKISAEEIMVKNPTVVYANDKLSTAADLMIKYNYNQLPVLDDSHGIYGMLYDIEMLGVFQ